MTTQKSPGRGRPRQFNPEEAVCVAQQLFHARGYDGVSVAELTEALKIKPPSFYAAFGSKAQLYERVLDRYTQTKAIPLAQILAEDRPLAASLAQVLESAAHCYAADPEQTGCMVMEGARAEDPQARAAACEKHVAALGIIRSAIAARYPVQADEVTDFVCTTMAGMSATARHGWSLDRLLATARLASSVIVQALPA